MSKLVYVLLAGASLLATTAAAQTTFHFGVRAGANLANQTQPNAPSNALFREEDKYNSIVAGQAGLVMEARFGQLAFQPALLFSQKGTKISGSTTFNTSSVPSGGYDYSEGHTITRTNWLELPLNFVYTPKGDQGFQVFAGPYLAALLSGRQSGAGFQTSSSGAPRQEHSFDQTINYADGTGNRRLDWGVNFGVGYRQGPVQLQVGYGLGLRSLYDSKYNQSYNRGAQLTATYFWGK